MKMRRKAQVHRSDQSPSRTFGQAKRVQRRRGPAARLRAAIRLYQPNDGHSGRNLHRPEPARAVAGAELSAPPLPLTLPAMNRTPHPHGQSLGRSVAALVSVLALLAFACFPVVAQAETVYESEDTNLPGGSGNAPTIPHKNTGPGGSSPGADASNASDGDGGSGQPGDESSGSQGGASGGGNPGSPGGGSDAQGKAGDGANGAQNQAGGKLQSLEALNASAPANSDDGSSSPLVPILIAVAVLAAISVGAVLARQRRGSGSPVSPKAS